MKTAHESPRTARAYHRQRTGGARSVAVATGRAASPLAAETETFLWDGLALIGRGGTLYVNEPHPNGGSPILSSSDGVMFNDILGTTTGTDGKDGYATASLTAFGDSAPGGSRSVATDALFTGKPHVDGLGYAFLFRNYRPTLGKWQTADPLGYPDGWNQMAYCRNSPISGIDYLGGDFWTVDENSGHSIDTSPAISGIGSINIVRSAISSGERGLFHMGEACFSYDRVTEILTVIIPVGICIDSVIKNNSAIPVGAIAQYDEHDATDDDSALFDEVPFEAVRAHEWGHASYYFKEVAPSISASIATLEPLCVGKSDDWIAGQIRQIVNNAYNSKNPGQLLIPGH